MANHKHAKTRELEGNRSKQPIPKPLPLQGLPEKPDGLNDDGLAFWKLAAGELGAVGVAKRIDSAALHQAADCWQRWRACCRVLDMQPFNETASRDYSKYANLWLKLCGRLGLTPIDRKRLEIAATDQADEEDQFFRVTG